ncbi:MAG TPA: beta-lactamase family protein [Candidatus Dietzia intestinigallinarum]|nr:beta-lactamase family protein [Candidatus Dietzia intestinigallinarum]
MNTPPLSDPRVDAAIEEALATTEVGLQVAAYLDGDLIIDTYGGSVDENGTSAVDSDTLFFPFSVTKAVTSTTLHVQAGRGLVDYDTPIAEYWPGWGKYGKEAITVRHVLTHQSGVPWMPEGVTPELKADWDWMIRGFEEMSPDFPIGTNCYHALGWGWIIAEIIQRTDPDNRPFAQVAREELLDPIGATDLYFGLPASEDHRLAPVIKGEIPESTEFPMFFDGMPRAVHPSAQVFNLEITRRTVDPGAGAITNARSMAAHWALLANKGTMNGVRLLSEKQVESFLEKRPNSEAVDKYLGISVPVSKYGYYLSDETPGMIPIITPDSPIVWMPGAGSSVGWAELDTGLAVAITHNNMEMGSPPSWPAIAEAVRAVAADMKDRNEL